MVETQSGRKRSANLINMVYGRKNDANSGSRCIKTG